MKRNYGIDLMRIFLCLCVIALHSLAYLGINNDTVSFIFMIFFLQANGAFFILSGYFNLYKDFNNSSDIKEYYKHKIIYILFPFLAFVLVWELWDYLHINPSFDFVDFLKTLYISIMYKSSLDHMWFMYPLCGMLISTPFLSKMLHRMDDKELKILWYITIGWNVVRYFLCYDFDIDFAYSNWIFDGWICYYFAGYYYRRVIANESETKWLLIGILSFVLTVLGGLYVDPFVGVSDLQPFFFLFCISCVMFFDKAISIKNEKIGKTILFISKNTFLIYLVHIQAMGYIVRKLNINDGNLLNGLIVIFTTFILSLVLAVIANTAMKPIQKLIDRKWLISNK